MQKIHIFGCQKIIFVFFQNITTTPQNLLLMFSMKNPCKQQYITNLTNRLLQSSNLVEIELTESR